MTVAIDHTRLIKAIEAAEHKLAYIIMMEGDADGARREPWYMDMLIREEMRNMIQGRRWSDDTCQP